MLTFSSIYSLEKLVFCVLVVLKQLKDMYNQIRRLNNNKITEILEKKNLSGDGNWMFQSDSYSTDGAELGAL